MLVTDREVQTQLLEGGDVSGVLGWLDEVA